MKDVEEAGTGGEVELFTDAVYTSHCQEHGNRRAESKEVAGSKHQLWIAHHRHPGATSTDDEIHRCVRRGSQQWITVTITADQCHRIADHVHGV